MVDCKKDGILYEEKLRWGDNMKTSGYVIRDAVKEDAARVDELLTELIRYETRFDKNLNKEYTVISNYIKVIGLDGHKLLVVETEGKIVGFLYGFIYQIPGMFARPVALLDALYVLEEYRQNGCAGALFLQFKQFAHDNHANSIELKVISENLNALHFYEKLGFCESKKYMQLECL